MEPAGALWSRTNCQGRAPGALKLVSRHGLPDPLVDGLDGRTPMNVVGRSDLGRATGCMPPEGLALDGLACSPVKERRGYVDPHLVDVSRGLLVTTYIGTGADLCAGRVEFYEVVDVFGQAPFWLYCCWPPNFPFPYPFIPLLWYAPLPLPFCGHSAAR